MGVCEVVVEDFGYFGEMLFVLFFCLYGVNVEFFVKIVEQFYSLDDYGVDFFSGEFEFVVRYRV